MPGFVTLSWPQPHCPWHESIFMQGEQKQSFWWRPCGLVQSACTVLENANGMQMRRYQTPGSTIRGPKFGKRQASGHGHFRFHSYMQHLPTGACMKTWTLVLPGHAGSSNASNVKHSESLDPDRRHADAPGYTTLPFVVLAVVRRYGDTWWADIP